MGYLIMNFDSYQPYKIYNFGVTHKNLEDVSCWKNVHQYK